MDLRVNICGVELKNPITTASGTLALGMNTETFLTCLNLAALVSRD